MEGIIVILGIIIAIINAVNNSKKVKKNAPGRRPETVQPKQSAEPQQIFRTARPAEPLVTPVVPVRPAPQPAAPVTSGQETFWKQVSEALREEAAAGKPVKGHGAVGQMPEGVSRECDHGSLGGSMAYEGHQGGQVTGNAAVRKKPAQNGVNQPAISAEEMRRAVVMAEILKRPQDRMAEQARRWSVR